MPEGLGIVLTIFNNMGNTIDWAGIEILGELYGITDYEALILDLLQVNQEVANHE